MALPVEYEDTYSTSRLAGDRNHDVQDKPFNTVALPMGDTAVQTSYESARMVYTIAVNNASLPSGSGVNIPLNGKMYFLNKEDLQYIADNHSELA